MNFNRCPNSHSPTNYRIGSDCTVHSVVEKSLAQHSESGRDWMGSRSLTVFRTICSRLLVHLIVVRSRDWGHCGRSLLSPCRESFCVSSGSVYPPLYHSVCLFIRSVLFCPSCALLILSYHTKHTNLMTIYRRLASSYCSHSGFVPFSVSASEESTATDCLEFKSHTRSVGWRGVIDLTQSTFDQLLLDKTTLSLLLLPLTRTLTDWRLIP